MTSKALPDLFAAIPTPFDRLVVYEPSRATLLPTRYGATAEERGARMTDVGMNDVTVDDAASASGSHAGRLIGVLLAGAAVSITLGVYGNEHTPTFERPFSLFFTDTINLKVWFATVAASLAVAQLL